MNFKHTYSEAGEFRLAANVCFRELFEKKYFPKLGGFGIPIMHNFAFSIELYLKCLLIKEGKPSTGHDIYKLYSKLKNKTKEHICAKLGMRYLEILDNLVKTHSNLYNVRYIYQGKFGKGHVDFNFLISFSEALDKTIFDLYIKN